MPPLSEVFDALTHAVLPAAIASAAVFALLTRLLPARFAAIAAVFALAAGFAAGNQLRGAIEYRLDSERPLTLSQLAHAAKLNFVSVAGEEPEFPPPSYFWLPWTVGLALVAGLVARGVHFAVLAWPIRAVAIAAATALAVPADLRHEAPWALPAFFALSLLIWVLLEQLEFDGAVGKASVLAPAGGAVYLFAAGVVLMHAHSARLGDLAVILFSALGPIAVVCWWLKADGSAVSPAIAVALPTLMLSGYRDTFSEVPFYSFLLAGIAPVALAPLALRRSKTLRPRARLGIAGLLVLLPTGLAIAGAMHAESLAVG